MDNGIDFYISDNPFLSNQLIKIPYVFHVSKQEAD